MKSFLILSSALILGLSAATAGTNETSFSEVRELIVPSSGTLDANTGGVGAIAVQGWDKDYVSVRATITTNDRADLALVQLGIANGRIWAFSTGAKSWGVEYEISVPRQFGLHLETKVGAIEVSGATGVISTETSVGAISLRGLGGDVTATTSVGAIDITLTGAGWEGKGLTAATSTGAIRITAPNRYAAHFDLSTNLGGITTTFRGAHPKSTSFMGKELVFDSAGGGSPIRATTSVGRIELLVSGGR
jgi:hypothetical protein